MADMSAPLDINSASRDELISLPGVGPAMADRIIAARPFISLDDVQRIEGLGPVLIERITPLITISDLKVAGEMPFEQSGQEDSDQIESQIEDEIFEQGSELESRDVIASSDEEVEPLSTEQIPEQELDSVETENDEKQDELILESVDSDVDQAEAEDYDDSPIEMGEEMEHVDGVMPPADESQTATEDAVETEEETVAASKPKLVTRGDVLLSAVGCSLISLIIAIVLTLGILAGINGGLNYVSPAALFRISGEVERVGNQIDMLEQDINNIESYLEEIEDTSERVEILEAGTEQLQNDLDALATQVEDLSSQVGEMEDDLTNIQARNIVFQGFLDGLRELLEGLDNP